jgi:hypothetical protein
MAVQKKPVRRKVALKVIKPGMDSKQVIYNNTGFHKGRIVGVDGSSHHTLPL